MIPLYRMKARNDSRRTFTKPHAIKYHHTYQYTNRSPETSRSPISLQHDRSNSKYRTFVSIFMYTAFLRHFRPLVFQSHDRYALCVILLPVVKFYARKYYTQQLFFYFLLLMPNWGPITFNQLFSYRPQTQQGHTFARSHSGMWWLCLWRTMHTRN